jgi:nicotinamide phosphoribosyltransferase
MKHNPLLQTDGYKLTHWKQYPKDAQIVYSYLESRGGMFKSTAQVGLQYYLKEYLQGQYFNREDVKEAQETAKAYFGNDNLFNKDGWNYLLEHHGGRLPIRISAIPEGHMVNTHNALVTVENTDPNVPWLTNYIESLLLKVWYPITVATLSNAIRQVIGKSLALTGDPSLLLFKLHDFGYRGVSSEESSWLGGFAHLTNFMGTDTFGGIQLAARDYNHSMAGFSIPASEHSTITSWGGPEHEAEAMENMLDQYPTGLVACVSDSYDIANAVSNIWGGTLRDKVISRRGTLIVRPDSGEPLPVILQTFEGLWEKFGGEVNYKGYKVLAPCVRVIQGDGVNFHSISQIVRGINDAGWSMDNLAFGMGGALLQSVNRDTQKFAWKASAIMRNGKWHPVYKNPKTDPGKQSKAGRFFVSNASGRFVTMAYDLNDTIYYPHSQPGDMLETVFENGEVKKEYNLNDIRQLLSSYDTF